MGLEVIIFIAAILFGIFIYWRESNGNGFYRFVNKLVNSKDLQMKPSDKKGFVYKQAFMPRFLYVAGAFLFIAVVFQFLTPFKVFSNYYGVSIFASSIVGILLGTYIANLVFKSGEIIDEKSESFEGVFNETIEKGKDLIGDLKEKGENLLENEDEVKEEVDKEAKEESKSARERLKDKGLL
ncbi:hypothetical protein [Oceanihabitans sediminis]|uniref:Uncharacterized protein n=1 Tax=Oceanihabitans sediminis TaxID=1812012 RepID=A0A368P448_9FLAO|nr:hypothetical protein [Oceanihabitans sediminis]MDX1277519.1 hypothetical protein [Oceanihabitans sediminis]MDX1773416.1 hypothetical protein [Oceanihabitans sediminis]RBP32871.1 hypothetical protein DFR65_102207 [Oceanihabitans sediminis]RCU57602.1 hypothetical protein DU428_07345 [Oceanihabitans sediminis]